MSEQAKSLFDQVNDIIENDIRPYIEADGGRITLKSVEADGDVFVELAGACAGCPGAAMTLKGGVERILKSKIAEIKEVKLAY
jgi:Fe-S cluster biogenesis protein NfuA